MDVDDDGFNAAFSDLKEKVEALAAGRAKLSVKQYCGTGGIRVVCQEAYHHNFDLTHEHWSEIIEPCLEQDHSDEVFLRRKSHLAFVHMLLTGDKAAGKTTFLNGLTTGDLRVLQCLRYESALFYNIWYAPSTSDLADLHHSLSKRALPFFQTELAHGGMLMDSPELRFFLEDEEFSDGQPISQGTAAVLDDAQHVMIKMLELGGDGLHELVELERLHAVDEGVEVAARHPVKVALLQQTAASVRMAARVGYFVNLESLFCPNSQHGSLSGTADAGGSAVLVERLGFLHRLLREDAEVLFFCTRKPHVEHSVAVALICSALSLSPSQAENMVHHCQGESLVPLGSLLGDARDLSMEAQSQLQIVHWLAMYAGFAPSQVKVAAVEHLCEDGSIDHTAVLQSLRRLLGGSPLSTTDSALQLLVDQVAHLLLDNKVACIDKDTLADLLDPFEESGHAELYRNVVHPMVVVPSMVLLDSFPSIMTELVARGLAYPVREGGQINLGVHTDPKSFTVRLHAMGSDSDSAQNIEGSSGQEQTVCWRVLVQREVVIEAVNALNLFQLKGRPPPVPCAAAVRILTDAWTRAACSGLLLADAFSELFLASRFLILNGHDKLPETWSLKWDSTAGGVAREEAAEKSCLLLQVPQDVFTLLPSQMASSDSQGPQGPSLKRKI